MPLQPPSRKGEFQMEDFYELDKVVNHSFEEMKALMYILGNPTSGNKRTKLMLPNHMRRRASSHNINRVPKRLREKFLTLRKKSNTREGKVKVPRGKIRRRPKIFVEEYTRRQKTYTWLETHLWHAKRFKMEGKWGYKIPMYPYEKCFKACYRGITEHCLIQDISFYNCIELSGKLGTLLEGLGEHINKSTNISNIASYLDGTREGSALFYHRNSYPMRAIGEIKYMWNSVDIDGNCKIWIWVHPSFVDELCIECVKTFELTELPTITKEEDIVPKELKKLPHKVRKNYASKTVKLTFIKLNRFRLIGPLSQAIISKVFKPVNITGRDVKDWVSEYYKDDAIVEHYAQTQVWNEMENYSTPAQLKPNIILPITIYDPRCVMPKIKTKAIPNDSIEGTGAVNLVQHKWVPLWDPEYREKITLEKFSTKQINDFMSMKLSLGMDKMEQEHSNYPAFPIIAIQRPGSQSNNKRIGIGCGWDLICLPGFGMPLWMGLVLSGGRPGGLRETESLLRESNTLETYPPDTLAGAIEEQLCRDKAKDSYFSLPPAKRHNYNKLGIPNPFYCPWNHLMQDWRGTPKFYVLRDRATLKMLADGIKSGSFPQINLPPNGLVGVSITCKSKGLLDKGTHICLITPEDAHTNKVQVVEPEHQDSCEMERSTLLKSHKTHLKMLARKRRRNRLKLKEGKIEIAQDQFLSDKVKEKHLERWKSLWLPDLDTIRFHCAREIFGFVTNGGFSFSEAISTGIGYVTLDGLHLLINQKVNGKVLVRTTNTLHYRLAKLQITTI